MDLDSEGLVRECTVGEPFGALVEVQIVVSLPLVQGAIISTLARSNVTAPVVAGFRSTSPSAAANGDLGWALTLALDIKFFTNGGAGLFISFYCPAPQLLNLYSPR